MISPTNILGLDWETYYDDEYTLKKLTTTVYVRDARFQAFGASVRWNNEHRSKWLLWDELTPYLKAVDWKNTALLAHNAHFDGLILTHHLKHKPAYYYDTVSMARALYNTETRARLDDVAQYLGFGSKVEGYLDDVKGQRNPTKTALKKLGQGAKRDNDLMWKIFRHMLEEFPEDELDLIHYTIKCYTEPVIQVNKKRAQSLHKRVVRERKAMLRRVAGVPRFTQEMYQALCTKLRSRKQFPEMMRSLGVKPPLKISKSWLEKSKEDRDPEKKYTFAFAATDLSFLALKEHIDPRVRELIEAKLMVNSSLHETRPLRMIQHADPSFPVYLNYWGARTTGRWSGGDKMNAQNLGRDGKLRGCLLAPKGHKFVIGDSAAIAAILNAYTAGQGDLLEQFADKSLKKRGMDPYTIMASDVFGRPITKKDPKERYVGKTTILGCGYQMGAAKLQYTFETGSLGPVLVLEQHMYKQLIDLYRHKMDAIVKQWWFCNDRLKDMMLPGYEQSYRAGITFAYEALGLPNEMWLQYPRLRWADIYDEDDNVRRNIIYSNRTKLYGGKLVENMIQALARVVVGQQYLRIADKYRMVLLAHDEIVLCVPERKVKRAKSDLMETLCLPPPCVADAPLGGEVGVFDHYVKM